MGIVCQLYFSNSPTVFYLLGGKGNNLSRKLKLGRRIERCWVVLTWVLGKAVGPWEKWQAHNFFCAFFVFVFLSGQIWQWSRSECPSWIFHVRNSDTRRYPLGQRGIDPGPESFAEIEILLLSPPNTTNSATVQRIGFNHGTIGIPVHSSALQQISRIRQKQEIRGKAGERKWK